MLVSNRVYDVVSRIKQNRAHTRYDPAKKQLVPLTIDQLAVIAKGWPQMKLVTMRIMSSLLRMFLMTQCSGKYFHKTELL